MDWRALRQCQQQWPDHDAVMAHGRSVHVFANQSVAHDSVDEGGVGRRHPTMAADDVAALGRQGDRGSLPACRQIESLEGASEEIEQAELRLVHRSCAQPPEIDPDDGIRKLLGTCDHAAAPFGFDAQARISTPAHSSTIFTIEVKSESGPKRAFVAASICLTSEPATIGTPRFSASSTHMRTSL